MKKLLLIVTLLFSTNAFAQADAALNASASKGAKLNPDIDFATNDFSLKAKGGLIYSTGNTESLNISVDSKTKYRIKRFENKLRLGAFFTDVYSTANGSGVGKSAEYYYGVYRLDYYLSQKATIYAGGGAYVDEISGMTFAGQTFLGGSYCFCPKGQKYSLKLSGGYNFTHENRAAPAVDANIHSAQQELNFQYVINDNVTFNWDATALENVEILEDFRATSDMVFAVKLSKIFSLNAGWRLRFDNQPVAGFEKLDMIQDLSLGVEF